MDKTFFGSTSSLGGLLNEALFNEGEADQFLQELGGPLSKGFDVFGAPAGGTSGVTSDVSGDKGFASDAVSGALAGHSPADGLLTSVQLPTDTAALTQAWPAVQTQGQPAQAPQVTTLGNLALLSQLLDALKAAPETPQPRPQPQPANNLIAQFATAFKPSTPPAQAFAPISQAAANPAPVQPLPSKSTLPSLNLQQQQALQSIMSFGQLGNSVEGKKVRRMMSNRESARRSRHRKQAHVIELEERAARLEAENVEMKESLACAGRTELQATEERVRMDLELNLLRRKVVQLEGLLKGAEGKPDSAEKRGTSNGSSAGVGHTSEDSCCDSMPDVRSLLEQLEAPCCKRCKTADAVHA